MKILISACAFFPNIGGIETTARVLAEEFTRAGHQIIVVTQTPSERADAFPFAVVRRPGRQRLLGLVRWCDVFLHVNLSLRSAWPRLLIRRPWFVCHQGSYCLSYRPANLGNRIKRFAVRFAHCISISSFVAGQFRNDSIIIPNPYDDAVFRRDDDLPRERCLVFAGRLVSEKGVDVLLEALRQLKLNGLQPSLTIIGEGPERPALEAQSDAAGLNGQVCFMGAVRGTELARALNAHQIMVVPSRFEAFGIVAIEGIACGCVAVAAEVGGLPEVIGPCGHTYPAENFRQLAVVLAELLQNAETMAELRHHATAHLSRFKKAVVARSYLEYFSRVTGDPAFPSHR